MSMAARYLSRRSGGPARSSTATFDAVLDAGLKVTADAE